MYCRTTLCINVLPTRVPVKCYATTDLSLCSFPVTSPIRTRPGYASSMAYDIDNNEFSEILGTIAGDDTIMLVLREGVATSKIRQLLSLIIPNIE